MPFNSAVDGLTRTNMPLKAAVFLFLYLNLDSSAYTIKRTRTTFETRRAKMVLMYFADSVAPDQPAHARGLI